MRHIIIYGIVALFFAMATQATAIPFSSPLEGELNVDAVDNLSSIERDTVTPALDLMTTSQTTIGSATGRATYRFTNETQEAVFDITYDEMSLDPNDNLVRINGIIGFSLDEPVTYMVEGNFSGTSKASAVRFLNQAGLAPIGEPGLYGEVDQEINGLTLADFTLNEIPEGNFTGGSDLNFGARTGTLQPGGYEFSYEGLILNMDAGDHRISGSGGVRLRLRAFSEPGGEPDEPNCNDVPATAFVLSHLDPTTLWQPAR